ncbi:MFS transporter [Nocardioides insulae]|uniref:MFS transporter n=1 Tax=Nocardioides insulae TaxID=394734 RepID=UPI00048B08A6|nr:MFS transporter [Nocardioides insulae]
MPTSHRSRIPVYVLCWLCLVADGYDLMTYGATLPALIGGEPFRLTPDQAGHIGSLALAGMLVGSLLAGTLTDRVGRRRIFILSVTAFSLGMILTALAPSVGLFVTFRVLTCVGVGGLLPTAVALASEFTDPAVRSRTLGLVLTGPPVGMVLASLLASWLVPEHGFRPVYALAGSMLLVVPFLVRLLPESPGFLAVRGDLASAERVRAAYGLQAPAIGSEGPSATGARRSSVATLVSGPMLLPTLLIWGTTFCSLLTVFGITTWLPQAMSGSGYGLGSSIQFLLVYCLGAVIGTVVAAVVAERVGPKPVVVVGFVVAAAALLVVSLQPATAPLVVLLLLAGFGGFGTQNILNDFIARFYPVHARASGLGWALGVGRLGGIIGPTFGAWAVGFAQPLTATAVAFALTALLGGLLMLFVPRTAPSASLARPRPESPSQNSEILR